jgi:hypothetical protein
MIGIGLNIGNRVMGGGGAAFDPDAQAFFDRVTTAGGTLSTTEKNATNQLVLDMKSAGIWSAMKAIYPMVGASAAACAQNLKSSSFTGTFTSGWTFASTGVTPNGTSAYMSTGLIPSANLSLNNASISVYLRTNVNGLRCDISVIQDGVLGANDQFNIFPRFNDEAYFRVFDGSSATVANTNSQGWYLANRVSSSGTRNFKNSTLTTKTVSSGTINTSQIIVGAGGGGSGLGSFFSNRENSFASIGDGLTDTQASNFYTAVQAMQVTLSRSV